MDFAVEMLGITKRFGSKAANDNVDLRVRPGSVHALLGENGAGKSTLMNVLYGHMEPDEGRILIRGKEEIMKSPLYASSLGIGMVHQHFMLVKPMTVAENIMLASKSKRGPLLDLKRITAEIREVSDKYGLDVDPDSRVKDLSVGQQQRAEILTAVFKGADILILDEPTAVLTAQETEALFGILRQMREDGKSVILITHKLDEIMEIADEVTVLRDGKLVGSRMMDETLTRDDLTQMMIGRKAISDFRVFNEGEAGTVPLVQIKNVHARTGRGVERIKGVTLDVRKGEILGLAGVDGNGQKELAMVLTGLLNITEGEILYDGKRAQNRKPSECIRDGIAHVPEDRIDTGIAMDFSVKNNMIMKNFAEKRFRKAGVIIDYDKVNAHAEELIDKYDIKTKGRNEIIRFLSGGNQQKVVIARELDGQPRFLIASHPTRGLDVGAAEFVQKKLIEQRNKGVAVLLISSNLDEIRHISDRIAVIYDGHIMGILPGDTSAEEIGLYMLGQKVQPGIEYKKEGK